MSHRRGSKPTRRRVCFVTGTRADFGLMARTLKALGQHPELELQIVATGMHLDRRRGRSIDLLREQGWRIDATVPWSRSDTPVARARATGRLTTALAEAFAQLRTDLVLLLGDRVEALAAATAGHLSDLPVAHVHGGDRATGQADDSIRHAITKLAHVHFPATPASAARLLRLGEDRWRIHRVGAPGVEGIGEEASPALPSRPGLKLHRRDFALLVLHPIDPNDELEFRRARSVLSQCLPRFAAVALIDPNNDPGAEGIVRAWDRAERDSAAKICRFSNLARADYLALLRDCAVLVGNSSSGIIEAGSFKVPVVDIGPRQHGREVGANVFHAEYRESAVKAAIARALRFDRRAASGNPYVRGGTSHRIATTLARLETNARLLRKCIAY